MSWIENRIAKVKEGGSTELDLSVPPRADADSADHLSEFPKEILELRSLTALDLSGISIEGSDSLDSPDAVFQ